MSLRSLDLTAIGARLRTLRENMSGLSQSDWATKHGFSRTQYNNWELGNRRIPIEASERLCQHYGLTLAAIYLGRFDGLSPQMTAILLDSNI